MAKNDGRTITDEEIDEVINALEEEDLDFQGERPDTVEVPWADYAQLLIISRESLKFLITMGIYENTPEVQALPDPVIIALGRLCDSLTLWNSPVEADKNGDVTFH